jgi:hypothetical protein
MFDRTALRGADGLEVGRHVRGPARAPEAIRQPA